MAPFRYLSVFSLALVLLGGARCSSSPPPSPDGKDAAAGGRTSVGGTGGAGGTTQPQTGSGGTAQTGGSNMVGGGNATGGNAGAWAGAGGKSGSTGGNDGAAGASGGGAAGNNGQGGIPGIGGIAQVGGTPQPGGSGGAGNGGIGGTGGVTGDIFVATTGSDSNPGTQDKPLKTLAAAQTAVRVHPNLGKSPLTVAVLPGTYYVGKTIVFTSADSGTQTAPVTYRGFGAATLSGGVKLNLTWSSYKNNIMQANVPASASSGLSFDMLFLNGQRQVLARYPNYDATKTTTPFGGVAGDYMSSRAVSSGARAINEPATTTCSPRRPG